MGDDLQRAFASLATDDDRRDALRKFVRTMDSKDRTYLLNFLAQHNDPLFALPVELVLQIFSYLPVFCTWTLQRTSRRWQDLLSSDQMIRFALSRFQTHDEADSALSHEQAAAASLESRVQHLKALGTGRHFNEMVIDNSGPSNTLHARILLKGSHVAYFSNSSSQGDALTVRNLITGDETNSRAPARGRACAFVLSSSLAGWITYDGFLHVLYHTKPSMEVERVRLPSPSISDAVADDDSIALMLGQPHHTSARELVLYEAGPRRLQSFELDTKVREIHATAEWTSSSCGLLIDSGRRAIDVFIVMTRKVGGSTPSPAALTQSREHKLKFVHVRLSFDGQWISSTSWPLDDNWGRPEPHLWSLTLRSCHPTGQKDEYMLVMRGTSHSEARYADLYRPFLLFNTDSCTFVKQDLADHFRIATAIDPKLLELTWKDQNHRPPLHEGWFEQDITMNDTFLVSLERDTRTMRKCRILVRCFDPDVRMAQRGNGE